MKKIFTLLFMVLSVVDRASAQSSPPNGMIYQAVARDASGNLASKRTIYVQTSILKNNSTGTVMYSDEHKVTSNADAMFTLIVGQGTYLTGAFKNITSIPWEKDKYFFNLKICVAPSLPKTGWKPSYTDMGTTQFWSVPYAFFSGKSADSLTLTINGTGRQIKLGNNKPIFFSVADKDSVATNEIQSLTRLGGKITLSLNGGMVTLPDSSSVNELQYITRKGGRLELSLGGGTITLPDSSASNELQKISRTGGKITLDQNGGTISLPDSSASNELQTLTQSGKTITLSQSGGSITLTDDDKQQLGISGNKGTVTLSNGGTIQLADSSSTNEIQNLDISSGKGKISLTKNGGSITLNDSSASNELQKVSRSGGKITLDQNGGTINLPDSSASNELQTLSQSGNTISLSQGGGSFNLTNSSSQQLGITSGKGTISLSNGGGSIIMGDSSASNELQSLALKNDTLFISSGNFVKLTGDYSDPYSPAFKIRIAFNTSINWKCPTGVYKITVQLWGGAGGGGGYSIASNDKGCSHWNGGLKYTNGGGGGNGGNGGYNQAELKVTPGNYYKITIGYGGKAGANGNNSDINGIKGGNGESTLFDTLLTSKGGNGGNGGISETYSSCAKGSKGDDGSVTNYNSDYKIAIQTSQKIRSYVPIGYTTVFLNINCCSEGGFGGIPNTYSAQSIGATSGEDGLCVIIW